MLRELKKKRNKITKNDYGSNSNIADFCDL